MNSCPNCNAETEKGFEICWNCCCSLSGDKVIGSEEELDTNTELDPNIRKIACLRCNTNLLYLGVYRFHEGARLGVWGNFFELFVNRECFEIYVCLKCGKTEFFVPSDELRLITSRIDFPRFCEKNSNS